ncbi:MAG: hypothetical protein JWM57_3663 [Phycisphaerales bacterium]|nr:hypothetical protein [Phycisphaerales bacterium]
MDSLLELIFELVVNVFGELLFNWLFNWMFAGFPGPTRGVLLSVLLVIAGGLLGWASTALFPHPLIPWFAVRVVYVIVVPVAVAFVIDALNRRRVARGGRAGLLSNWTDAYFFALTFSVVRLAATELVH